VVAYRHFTMPTQSHLIYYQLSSQTIFALLLFLASFLMSLFSFSQAFVVVYIIYLFFHILFIIYFCMYFYAYSSAYFFGTSYIPYDLYIFMHYMYLYIYNYNYTKSDFVLPFLYVLISQLAHLSVNLFGGIFIFMRADFFMSSDIF
jgi:hypothetical protein